MSIITFVAKKSDFGQKFQLRGPVPAATICFNFR